MGDLEFASRDIIAKDGPSRVGEDEMVVTANDLTMALNGRIERAEGVAMLA